MILGLVFRGQAIWWIKVTADFAVLRNVAMATKATILGFLYTGCTLAPPGEYEWILRRCGLMSNYFDRLLLCPPI